MDEKRDVCLFKVGFTKDIEHRVIPYTTSNPTVKCISYVKTMEKSKRNVEKLFHDEVASRGYQFITAHIDSKKTEWFAVSYNDAFYGELITKGLNAFQCGKNRKNCGEYRK